MIQQTIGPHSFVPVAPTTSAEAFPGAIVFSGNWLNRAATENSIHVQGGSRADYQPGNDILVVVADGHGDIVFTPDFTNDYLITVQMACQAVSAEITSYVSIGTSDGYVYLPLASSAVAGKLFTQAAISYEFVAGRQYRISVIHHMHLGGVGQPFVYLNGQYSVVTHSRPLYQPNK